MESVIVAARRSPVAGHRGSARRRVRRKDHAGGEEAYLPYDRPLLSKQVLAGTWPPEKAVLADKKRSSELQVHEVLHHRAVGLDVAHAGWRSTTARFSRRTASCWPPGRHPAGCPAPRRSVRPTGSCAAHPRRLARPARSGHGRGRVRVVVIGAGRHRFRGRRPAPGSRRGRCSSHVDPAVQRARPTAPACAHCGSLHEANGVELRTAVAVGGIARVDRATSPTSARPIVALAGGDTLEADVVVVGIGVVPNTARIEGTAVEPGQRRRVRRPFLRRRRYRGGGRPGGAAWRHDTFEEPIRIEHWEWWRTPGLAASSLLAGRTDAPSFQPIPYFWSDQYGIRFQVLGSPGATTRWKSPRARSRRASSLRSTDALRACAP